MCAVQLQVLTQAADLGFVVREGWNSRRDTCALSSIMPPTGKYG